MAPRNGSSRRRHIARQAGSGRVRKVSSGLSGVSSLGDLYGGGYGGDMLRGEYHTEAVYAWFQKRHLKSGSVVVDDEGYYRRNGHEWKVPYGVRYALTVPLRGPQISNRYPWFVTWVSPKSGKRFKKKFGSIYQAIIFIAERAQYVDSDASIISRPIGYDVPPTLRGKFPLRRGKHVYYWCPCCLTARRFVRQYHASGDPKKFSTEKKFWNEEKQRFIFKYVDLAIMACTVCGITNRNQHWRRSNQPWEKRKIKKGVRRVKRRR